MPFHPPTSPAVASPQPQAREDLASCSLPPFAAIEAAFIAGSERRRQKGPLFVEPGVFHPPRAEDVVDVDLETFHIGLKAGPARAVIDDRPGVVLSQLALDRPQQLPAAVGIGLARLLF